MTKIELYAENMSISHLSPYFYDSVLLISQAFLHSSA